MSAINNTKENIEKNLIKQVEEDTVFEEFEEGGKFNILCIFF